MALPEGIHLKLPRDIDSLKDKSTTHVLMSQSDNSEKQMSRRFDLERAEVKSNPDRIVRRLQRSDLGPHREPYSWPVFNESFASDAVRQCRVDSCISAVGEMLTKAELTETELISRLGTPGNIDELVLELGSDWSNKKGPRTLADIGRGGPWAAEMLESPWARFPKSPHVVVVDGLSSSTSLIIRDPLEGTRYEMTIKDFLRTWNGRCIYRKVE